MLLERFYDEDLAHASYMIGCQAKGEALVIDARRDIAPYLALAEEQGMTITAVTETHIHADYLSGTRELAAATGAEIYISGEGGPDWTYQFDGNILKDGDSFNLGNIKIEAVHTPGHTPEHMSFLVTDGAFTDTPGYMFTGDFVFVGDLGRPDLLDEAAGFENTRFAGAKDLFKSLKTKFVGLADHIQIHPAHGAGSACGKALGSIPSSTVGYERLYAWWAKYIENDDEEGFINELLDGQPEAHSYFARMKVQNKVGPAVMGERKPLEEVPAEKLAKDLESGFVDLIDTRDQHEVRAGTVPGAIAVPGTGKTATFAAWIIDPEATDYKPMVVLAQDQADAMRVWDHLVRVGIDDVVGFVDSLDGQKIEPMPTIEPAALADFDKSMILDVRAKTEYNEGHIPEAHQLHSSQVMWKLDQLPEKNDKPIVIHCQSMARSIAVGSALRRAGYNVVELKGAYPAWAETVGTN